jgi:hypothetical protein
MSKLRLSKLLHRNPEISYLSFRFNNDMVSPEAGAYADRPVDEVDV